ncbi:hypothetical protein [Paenibacillus sp. NPDC058174]|uniref:hypothetical protein n=1 Tax=Paenibacillus sp. NPDC058174 TaxID=3346366 RepID=UPI0036DF3346
MASLQTFLEYNDPLLIVHRAGTPDDPFKQRTDSLPVINNVITLFEVPSELHKVQIHGLTEISMDRYRNLVHLNDNEFLVNYSNGSIQFHPSHEGKTFACSYYGRGLISYPASRIYAMVQRKPDIVVTLQDYINELQSINYNLDLKIIEVNQVIQNAIQATTDSNVATDNAKAATEKTEKATIAAIEAANSAIVIRKDPVDTYKDLATVYPEPENGWQVTINTTGDIYRYSGHSGTWELVGNYLGGTIPFASETSDGLLHKEDYQNFIVRSMFFSIPKVLSQGVQTIGLGKIPFDGQLIKAQAYCVEKGLLDRTEISIEKISEQDFVSSGIWDNIFKTNINIPAGEHSSSGGVIEDTICTKGDLFRINISQFDNSIKGITVQLDIKTIK